VGSGKCQTQQTNNLPFNSTNRLPTTTAMVNISILIVAFLFAKCDGFISGRFSVVHEAKLESMKLRMEKDKEKPTIAIVGSGAVGCYYGARLWETHQYNVMFHMRGEHYKVSKEKGLNVTSVSGDVFIPPEELMAFDKTEDMGKVDWVIMALKSTGIEATPSLLRPLLDENSRVLAIMNGLVDDDIVRLLEGQGEKEEPVLTKCAAVYGGMALLCSNRKAPGHVDHSYAGKLTASLAKTSAAFTDVNAHKEAMKALWEPTQGFEFCYDDSLVRARWSKNLWNLPFNGISVAMNGITVDNIVGDPGLRRLAYKGNTSFPICYYIPLHLC